MILSSYIVINDIINIVIIIIILPWNCFRRSFFVKLSSTIFSRIYKSISRISSHAVITRINNGVSTGINKKNNIYLQRLSFSRTISNYLKIDHFYIIMLHLLKYIAACWLLYLEEVEFFLHFAVRRSSTMTDQKPYGVSLIIISLLLLLLLACRYLYYFNDVRVLGLIQKINKKNKTTKLGAESGIAWNNLRRQHVLRFKRRSNFTVAAWRIFSILHVANRRGYCCVLIRSGFFFFSR